MKKGRNKNFKQITQYTLDGSFVKKWDNFNAIKQSLGFDYTNIIHCCKLKIKSSNGYIWRYVEKMKEGE